MENTSGGTSPRSPFRQLFHVLFGLILTQVFSNSVWAGETPRLSFAAQSMGNVFVAEQGALDILIDNAIPVVSGGIVLADETGNVVNKLPVTAGASKVSISLPRKGYYNISAVVRFLDGSQAEAHTTAAVIGPPLSEAERLSSSIGTWHVNGDLDLAFSAGSRWTRAMWGLNKYRLDSNGHVIPQPWAQRLDSRFFWIGSLAWGLPTWLEGRPRQAKASSLYPPADWNQLENLVKQFAQDVTDFPKVFEIYNEPEILWTSDPQDLVKFHAVVARAIKSVHPDTKVIGPCLWSIRLNELKRMVDLGLLDQLDGLALHGYVPGTPPEEDFIGRVVGLKRYLHSLGKDDFPIYITEFGWTSGGKEKGSETPVDELTQARYVSRAFSLLATQKITAAIYFVLLNKTDKESQAGFSLLHSDQSPKPAYAAYANVSKWLAGVVNPRWLKLSPTTHFLLFDKGKDVVAVVWDEDGRQVVFLPQSGKIIEDMMGRSLAPGVSLPVTPSPIFLKLKNELTPGLSAKSVIEAKPGDSLHLDYERVWLPAPLSQLPNGQVSVPHDVKNGSYIIFGKRGNAVEVFQLKVN